MLEYILICCSCCCWCWFCVSFLYMAWARSLHALYSPHGGECGVCVCVCIGAPLIHRLAELFICGEFCFVLLFSYAFAFVCLFCSPFLSTTKLHRESKRKNERLRQQTRFGYRTSPSQPTHKLSRAHSQLPIMNEQQCNRSAP